MKKSDLERLQQEHGYPAVSIFVPTHRSIPDKLQDRIRVKNMLKEARERLLKEYDKDEITQLLDRLNSINELVDYTNTLDGLAFFASADTTELFRLPFTVEERVIIDDNFETRDLIFSLNRTPQYWVLSLSEKFCRLFNGIGNTLIEMIGPSTDEYGEPTSGFPLNILRSSDREILAVSTGDSDAQYLDGRMRQFYHFVDDFFYDKYLENDPLPVILAGTERNLAFFNTVTKHPEAIVATQQGNFDYDQFSPGQFAQVIAPVVEKFLEDERQQVLKELEEAISKGQYAFSFEPIWRMATEGRIHKLLVEQNFSKAGKVNPKNPLNVILYDNPQAERISDDLVDNLIEMVLEKGGSVTFFSPGKLSDHEHIAAILRY